MDDSDRRLLVEKVLKEPWHTLIHYLDDGTVKCLCGKLFRDLDEGTLHVGQENYRTFTTRSDMMDLYEAIQKAGEWRCFIRFTGKHWMTDCSEGEAERELKIYSLTEVIRNTHADFYAWLFCLDGTGYEDRCQIIADWAKGEKEWACESQDA